MVRHGLAPSGQSVHIEQGVEMQRPSHLYVRADVQSEKATNVRVGGHTVTVAQGEYIL